MQKNVLGGDLRSCCDELSTGFYRNGRCETDEQDIGMHTVCANVTKEFLEYSKSKGNDLITPFPDAEFPGLKPGDKWCLCVHRWIEALEDNKAPNIYLQATHSSVLEYIELEVLAKYALDSN